jgi:hypothetical protein
MHVFLFYSLLGILEYFEDFKVHSNELSGIESLIAKNDTFPISLQISQIIICLLVGFTNLKKFKLKGSICRNPIF